MKGTVFECTKALWIGKVVVINGCSFIPNGTKAKVASVSFTIRDVMKLTLVDLKTMKMFDLDINNHQAILDIIE